MDTQKEIVGGLYYQKAKPYLPVAYTPTQTRVQQHQRLEQGELLPVDAIGMGASPGHTDACTEAIKTIIVSFSVGQVE